MQTFPTPLHTNLGIRSSFVYFGCADLSGYQRISHILMGSNVFLVPPMISLAHVCLHFHKGVVTRIEKSNFRLRGLFEY